MRKILNPLVRLTLIALCLSIFLNIALTHAAFGISPPWIQNDLLRPGYTLEEVIHLSRSDASKAMRIKLRVDGDEELLKWMEIKDADSLVMQQGQGILPMSVIIKVPQDAVLGNYRAGIYVSLMPLESETQKGGEVAIALGAHIAVEISVIGKEVTDYKVSSVSVKPQQEDQPFTMEMKVRNTGNTDVSEVEGEVQIYDKSNSEVIKTLAFKPLEEPVTFNETKEVKMVFDDFKPESGDYWIEVKAAKDGEVLYTERLPQKVSSEIIPVITPEDVLVSALTPEQEQKSIYLMAILTGFGLALLIVAGVLARPMLKGKKNRRPNRKKGRS